MLLWRSSLLTSEEWQYQIWAVYAENHARPSGKCGLKDTNATGSEPASTVVITSNDLGTAAPAECGVKLRSDLLATAIRTETRGWCFDSRGMSGIRGTADDSSAMCKQANVPRAVLARLGTAR